MNVIVSNKQKSIIDNANIDAIKDLNGLFNVDDLISKFKNYFFSKMILDATSIIDFASDEVLSKLANSIGGERLFILLPSSPEPPDKFIDNLNSLKIYNYSTNINGLIDLINNPKTGINNEINSSVSEGYYPDSDIKNDGFGNNNFENVDSYQKISDDFYSNMTLSNDINASNNGGMQNSFNNQNISNNSFPYSNMNFQTNNNMNNIGNSSISIGNTENGFINGQSNNMSMVIQQVPNMYANQNINNVGNIYASHMDSNKKIIGFKNVTTSAGSTTLIYMLMKKLVDIYKKKAVAIEINKNEFKYFQEKFFISSSESELSYRISNSNAEIILIDLNDCRDTSFCNDILYLVEPSIIKLNMIMINKPYTFKELKGYKIVLNKSLLSNSDVNVFAREAGTPIFYNIPPLNDRIENKVLDKFLSFLKLI